MEHRDRDARAGVFTVVESVSCGSAVSCTASVTLGTGYGFVVSERHGVWSKPVQLTVPF